MILIYLLAILTVTQPMQLFDFSNNSDLNNWFVVDDGVMGGRSAGNLSISKEGHGVFSGDVSLENNGGFSSLRYSFEQKEIANFSVCKIRLRGDGKRYQFRVKQDRYNRYSYISYFETSGEWETIEIPLSSMYPTFRGRKLDMPNFPKKVLEEVTFLIGNKTAESFKLELDWIILE